MYFYDTETEQYITMEDVRILFCDFKKEDPETYEGVTFCQYLNNCMTYNNGCLEDMQTRKQYLLREVEKIRFTLEDEADEEVDPLLQEIRMIERLYK